MTPDDVRMTAQLVVDGRVHCVSDEAVKALAQRVLELERWVALAALEAIDVEAAEREACAKLCDRLAADSSQPPNDFDECAAAIRARGAK